MELNQYQAKALETARYPGRDTGFGLVYTTLKLTGESGETSEHVGKAIRDDGFLVDTQELTPERKILLIKELGDVLWYIAAAASELGVTLEDVAVANNAKLADRKNRGVLGGSGDER